MTHGLVAAWQHHSAVQLPSVSRRELAATSARRLYLNLDAGHPVPRRGTPPSTTEYTHVGLPPTVAVIVLTHDTSCPVIADAMAGLAGG
jgi:hypothetical protein